VLTKVQSIFLVLISLTFALNIYALIFLVTKRYIPVAITDVTTYYLCIGEESFEHANVLSEKINFSALGGPGVAIFGPDDLHPMY